MSTGEPPAVRVRGLEVRAGGERILGPLDLEVEAREDVLLVGASGSGKTTLLRALAGLCVPSAGTLELFGRRVSDGRRILVAPEERRVGLLFQGASLWPHMSVERTLTFVLGLRGVRGRAARERARELLERVQLPGFGGRMPASLSGGERQRVALARALASEPRLLLLDEPLGPLDAALRASLLECLAHLSDELGWTSIQVTHDPEEARPFADRVLTLCDGRLMEDA